MSHLADLTLYTVSCVDVTFSVAELKAAVIFPDQNEPGVWSWVNKEAVYTCSPLLSFLRVSSFLELEEMGFASAENYATYLTSSQTCMTSKTGSVYIVVSMLTSRSVRKVASSVWHLAEDPKGNDVIYRILIFSYLYFCSTV
jgi:hypothetical protein